MPRLFLLLALLLPPAAPQTRTPTPSATVPATGTTRTISGTPTGSPTCSGTRTPTPTPTNPTQFCAGRAALGCATPAFTLPYVVSSQDSSAVLPPPSALVFSSPGGAALTLPLAPPPPYASASLQLTLPVAPAAGESLSITCSTGSSSYALTLTPPDSAAGLFSFASATGPSLASLAFPGISASLSASLQLALGISLTTPTLSTAQEASAALLTCTILSYATGTAPQQQQRPQLPLYPALSTLTLPLLLVAPTLPLLTDVLVEGPPCTFRSAWGGGAATAMPALDAATAGAVTARGASCTGSLPYSDPLVASNPATLASLRSSAAIVPPTPLTPGGPPVFSLLLAASATPLHLVLVSDTLHPLTPAAAFTGNTSVAIGGVGAAVNWVSPDGAMLSLMAPPYSSVCNQAGSSSSSASSVAGAPRDCGIQTLVVGERSLLGVSAFAGLNASSLVAGTPAAELLAAAQAQLAAYPLRLPLACPPACPGNWVGAAGSGGGGGGKGGLAAVAAAVDAGVRAAGSATEAAAAAADSLSGGLYFISSACAGFASPSSGACVNGSGAACAWGTPGDCAPCPVGALCPGGHRLWPQPGYWVGGESDAAVLPCPPPGETSRCPGWNGGAVAYASIASSGQALGGGVGFLCADATLSGSKGCSLCAANHYQTQAGACAPCPQRTLTTATLPLILSAALFTATALCLVLATRLWEGSFAKRGATPPPPIPLPLLCQAAAYQTLWGWAALQSTVQALRAAPVTAPEAQSITAWLSLLQFSLEAMPPACSAAPPFPTTPASSLVAAAGFTLAALVLGAALATGCSCLARHPSLHRPACASGSAAHFTALFLACALPPLAFAPLLNATLPPLVCTTAASTVRGYLALEQDGSTLRAALAAAARTPGWGSVPLDAAAQALSLPNALAQLRAFVVGGSSSSDSSLSSSAAALPAALRVIAPSLLAAPLTVATVASEPALVCGEGRHPASAQLAAVHLTALLLSSLFFSFLLPAQLLRGRMALAGEQQGQSAKVEARAWAVVESSWLWPLFPALDAARARWRGLCGGGGGGGGGAAPLSSLPPSTTHTPAAGAAAAAAAPLKLLLLPTAARPFTLLCSRPPPSPAAALLDSPSATPRLCPPATAPFLHTFLHSVHFGARPAALWTTCLEHAVLLALAIPLAHFSPLAPAMRAAAAEPGSSTTGAAAMQAAALLLCAAAAAAHARWRPFSGSAHAWRQQARTAAYAVTGVLCLRNALAWALLARGKGGSSSAALTQCVHALTLGVTAAVLALCLLVLYAMLVGIQVELGGQYLGKGGSGGGEGWGGAVGAVDTAAPSVPAPAAAAAAPPSSAKAAGEVVAVQQWQSPGSPTGAGSSSHSLMSSLALTASSPASNPFGGTTSSSSSSGGGGASIANPLHSMPLKLLRTLEVSKGVIIQASGRVILTNPAAVLSPLEEEVLRDLAAMVKGGHGLEGGLLCETTAGAGEQGGAVLAAAAAAAVTTAAATARSPPAYTPPPPIICSPRYALSSSPPPSQHLAACKPCRASITEGGQVYFLDGPGGPALAPGWQRFTSPGEAEADGVEAEAEAEEEVWYACIAPPAYLTASAQLPVYEPPYAPLPGFAVLPPFHARVVGGERYEEGEGGVRRYLDSRSGCPLRRGWREVTDGSTVWYSKRGASRSLWKAPLHRE